MTAWKKKLQTTLGVSADGVFGRATYTAFFRKIGARVAMAEELALAANSLYPEHRIDWTVRRFAHFHGQLAHESGGFRYMEEIWGPTSAQRRYEGRRDLGNVRRGDGFRYKGRGPIQITGRANYRRFGRLIGIDIERHPEIAAVPSIGLRLAVSYWSDRSLNDLADADDLRGVTRRINGGFNGLRDRELKTRRIESWAT